MLDAFSEALIILPEQVFRELISNCASNACNLFVGYKYYDYIMNKVPQVTIASSLWAVIIKWEKKQDGGLLEKKKKKKLLEKLLQSKELKLRAKELGTPSA